MYFKKYCNMLSNKIESVFSNCKYGDHTSLLTKNEYDQLKVFGMLNEFNRIYSTLIKQNANYKKKDALWAIYNDLRLKFEYKKDFAFLGIVFERQTEILINDRKYTQAIDTFITALYCYLYNYEKFPKELNMFDRHFNVRRREQLMKLMDKASYTKSQIKEEFSLIIMDNIPNLYIEEKVNYIVKNIIKRI